MSLTTRTIVLSAALTLAPAISHSATMIDMGTLGGTMSMANAVSSNGSVVVGDSMTTGNAMHAFKYTGTTMTDLGTLGGSMSTAYGASSDGSVIVGDSDLTGNTVMHAFTYAGGTMTDIGTLSGGTDSQAEGISSDGSVIVGGSNLSGNSIMHAFKYASGAMSDLGTLTGGTNSIAFAASSDGSVIVGYSNVNGSVTTHAFEYSGGTMSDLGTLSGDANSQAEGVSADGSVIVGYSATSGGTTHAFKYADGTMTSLGTLGGTNSTARAISADGTVIVGQSSLSNGNSHAFKYADGTMSDLGTLGGTLSIASGVSSDGSVIVGESATTGNAAIHAFVYRNSMVDINNTYTALAQNGAQLGAIINLKTTMLDGDLAADCDSFGARRVCLSVGGGHYAGNETAQATQTDANLKVAYKFSDKIHAGLLADWGFNTTNPNNFSAGKTPLFGAFATWGGELGAQVKLSAALNRENAVITRTALDSTEAGAGNTNINTTGEQAEVSYAKQVYNKATLRPYFGIRRTVVEREGYAESAGASFPITYNDVWQKETTLYTGLRASKALTSAYGLDAAFGGEYDISNTVNGYSGAINTMGDFSLAAPAVNKARLAGSLGGYYNVSATQKLTAGVSMAKETLLNATGTTYSAQYSLAF
jgi:probable HAF family extracellular repeat protein